MEQHSRLEALLGAALISTNVLSRFPRAPGFTQDVHYDDDSQGTGSQEKNHMEVWLIVSTLMLQENQAEQCTNIQGR